MYAIIERERLPENVRNRHYELMPDGRCIVSGREAKTLGTLEGVTIVFNSTELAKLRAKSRAKEV